MRGKRRKKARDTWLIVVAVGPVGKSPEEEVVLTCVAHCGTMHGQSSSAVCGGGTR